MIKKVFWTVLWAYLALGAVSSLAATATFTKGASGCTYGSVDVSVDVSDNVSISIACIEPRKTILPTATLIGTDGCTYTAADVDINGSLTVICNGHQKITFGTAPTVIVGGTGTVSATASSGLAVTFTSSTPGICTVSGNTVTGVAAGTCTIAANQADNSSYSPAPTVTQDISVKAAQSVTFGAAPSIAVDGTGVVSATASSGLPVIFSTLSQDVCTVSGNTVTGVAAGTCTIAANQAGNSIFSPASQSTQSFSIAPKQNSKQSQTITFGGAPIITAGKTGTVSATASSGLPVTFSSITTEICTVSGTMVTVLKANKLCIIVATQAGNETYAAVSEKQQFCIGACPKSKDLTPMLQLLSN